jgi:DNA-binding CsgD family transcriptional regulator
MRGKGMIQDTYSGKDIFDRSERLDEITDIVDPISMFDCRVSDEMKTTLTDSLTSLTPRERNVLELIFGIGSDTGELTLKQTAAEMGITITRVAQIRNKALRRMLYFSQTINTSKSLVDYTPAGRYISSSEMDANPNAKCRPRHLLAPQQRPPFVIQKQKCLRDINSTA